MSETDLQNKDDDKAKDDDKLDLKKESTTMSRTSIFPRTRQTFSAIAPPVVTKPVLRFMPTYRLEPQNPVNRERCERIIKSVMNRAFENYSYTPRTALNYCCQVAEEIKNRIKVQGYDRYRYVVQVTVGEKLWQGYHSYVNFLWDETRDGFLKNVFDDPKFFAIGTLFYLYYD